MSEDALAKYAVCDNNGTNNSASLCMSKKRIIVGISGASGFIYGVTMLRTLAEAGVETHCVISKSAMRTGQLEYAEDLSMVKNMATQCYAPQDMAASISSGSFLTEGMIVAPCSVRSLAEIATGVTTQLLTRAADVVLKDRRRLVLMVRETPLTATHIQNMLTVTQNGGIIAPPVPAFYQNPQSIDDLVRHSVVRVLDLFGLSGLHAHRWQTPTKSHPAPAEA
jgi:4-hydroxy-3-polyprenylbenzoate decarboxylase